MGWGGVLGKGRFVSCSIRRPSGRSRARQCHEYVLRPHSYAVRNCVMEQRTLSPLGRSTCPAGRYPHFGWGSCNGVHWFFELSHDGQYARQFTDPRLGYFRGCSYVAPWHNCRRRPGNRLSRRPAHAVRSSTHRSPALPNVTRSFDVKAAWYEKQGPAAQVLIVGEMPDPQPGPDEVRIRMTASGVNPGDVIKRQDTFGVGLPFPRVIPHSDGAGRIDRVGEAVPARRAGERVWCFGAQSYRPFGTAAEYVVVPSDQAVPLSPKVSFDQGACLGIPGITAHRAVHVAGPVEGRTLLVQGGAGAVGSCAIGLARYGGAHVIATIRSERGAAAADRAGAQRSSAPMGSLPTRWLNVSAPSPPTASITWSRLLFTQTLRPTWNCLRWVAPSPRTRQEIRRRQSRSGRSYSRISACSFSEATTSRPKRRPLPQQG